MLKKPENRKKKIEFDRWWAGRFIFIWLLVFVAVVPLVAQAAIVPCAPEATTTESTLPGGTPTTVPAIANQCTVNKLLEVPVNIFNFLLDGAAIVLLLIIVWAGVRMAFYWFNEQPEQELMAAKLTLTRGIFGFTVVALAILIVNILARTVLGLDANYFGQTLGRLFDLLYF